MSTSQVPPPPRPPRTEPDFWEKGLQKCKEQPFVPLGILATCAAFLGATYQLRSGNRTSFNRFLRARVIAQGATIAACVIGGYVYGSGSQAVIDRKAEERRQELEKIRLAGTGQAPAVDKPMQPSSNSRSYESSSAAPPPLAPAAQSFWTLWGVTSSGKP